MNSSYWFSEKLLIELQYKDEVSSLKSHLSDIAIINCAHNNQKALNLLQCFASRSRGMQTNLGYMDLDTYF